MQSSTRIKLGAPPRPEVSVWEEYVRPTRTWEGLLQTMNDSFGQRPPKRRVSCCTNVSGSRWVSPLAILGQFVKLLKTNTLLRKKGVEACLERAWQISTMEGVLVLRFPQEVMAMSAVPESIVFVDPMPQLTRKIQRAKRKLAADQSLAKPIEFTAAEARAIAEQGAQDLLDEGLPQEYADRYRATTELLLTKPLGW